MVKGFFTSKIEKMPRRPAILLTSLGSTLVLAMMSSAASSLPPQDARAYVGRSPDGITFSAYVTDIDTEGTPFEEGGSWGTVDEALGWARARANQVVLTYGFTADSLFSAGTTYYAGGDPSTPLPVWPPEAARREALDRQVLETVDSPHLTPSADDRLGVLEPEQEQGGP